MTGVATPGLVSFGFLREHEDRPPPFAFTSLFDRMRSALTGAPRAPQEAGPAPPAALPAAPPATPRAAAAHRRRPRPVSSAAASGIVPLRTVSPSMSASPVYIGASVPDETSMQSDDTASRDGRSSDAWAASGMGVPGFPLGGDVLDDTQSITTVQRTRSDDAQSTCSGLSSANVWTRRFRGEGLHRKYWMADETAKECRECLLPFTALRRRHHCRICGQIFCSRCASHLVPGERWGHKGAIRACHQCTAMLEEYDRRQQIDKDARAGQRRQSLSAPASGAAGAAAAAPAATTTAVPDLGEVNTPKSQFAANALFASDALPAARRDVLSAESDGAELSEQELAALCEVDEPTSEAAPFRSGLDEEPPVPAASTPPHEREASATSASSASPAASPAASAGSVSPCSSPPPLPPVLPLPPVPPAPSSPPSPVPIKRSTARQKLMRNASRFVTSTALGAISLVYFLRMLHQVLLSEHVDNVAEWKETVKLLALAVVERIRVRTRDTYLTDIRQFVKIKCFPGGRVSDCEFLDGYVCTKNAATKKMASFLPMRHARVMMIAFPIEYHRNAKQLMSLESIMAQEYEFLRILVARILALRPNVVVAEKGVSHIALRMFEDAGVAVFSCMKRTAMDTIAHCTQADVIASIDRLSLNPSLGRCACISIDAYQQADDAEQVKPLLRVEVTSKDVSSALVLRGAAQPTLRRIKAIVALMAFVGYNLRLEEFARRDLGAVVDWAVMNFHTAEPSVPVDATDDVHQHLILDETLKKYQRLLQTASITAILPPPYLVTRMKQVMDTIMALKGALPHEAVRLPHTDSVHGADDAPPFELYAPSSYAADTQLAMLEAERARIQTCWHACVTRMSRMLTPFAHQKLVALVFKTCAVTLQTCDGPRLEGIEFYGVHDEPLGQFLERTCDESGAPCEAKSCASPNGAHFLTYVHNAMRVQMVVEPFACPLRGSEHELLCWSYCTVCGAATPITRLSDEAWSLSYAKFLELQLYPSAACHPSMCEHDYFSDTVRYFALKNLAIRFHADRIAPWDLVVPPTQLVVHQERLCELRNTEAAKLSGKNARYWRSVVARLDALRHELAHSRTQTEPPLARLQAHADTLLEQLIGAARRDGADIAQRLAETYAASAQPPLCELSMNAVRRALQDRVAEWEGLFVDFDKRSQTNERELKRFADLYTRRAQGEDVDEPGTPNDKKALEFLSFLDFWAGEQHKEDAHAQKTQEAKVSISVDAPKGKEPKDKASEPPPAPPPPPMPTPVPVPTPAETKPRRDAKDAKDAAAKHRETIDANASELKEALEALQPAQHAPRSAEAVACRGKTAGTAAAKAAPDATAGAAPDAAPDAAAASPRELPREQLRAPRPMHPHRMRSDVSVPDTRTSSRSSARRDVSARTQVAMLARQYDQMARDAEQERRRQASRIRRNRPLATAHATVEVYKSLREAVRGDDSDHEEEPKSDARRGEAWLGKHMPATPSGPAPSAPAPTVAPTVASAVASAAAPAAASAAAPAASTASSHSAAPAPLLLPPPVPVPASAPALAPPPAMAGSAAGDAPHTPATEATSPFGTPQSDDKRLDMDEAVPERVRLFRMLEAAWTLPVRELKPLAYPFSPLDHIFTDARVIVREDEPSSLIAFTLDSKSYREQIEATRHERGASLLNELRGAEGAHYLYEFDTGTTKLWCKIFFAEQFDALRHMCGCAEQFIQSLSRCFKWDSRGGKSGSAFLKTRDDRFVVKQLSRTELDGFSKFAPQYFAYLAECEAASRPTSLTKIFGYFRIGLKNTHTGKSFKMDFMAMENLLYGRHVDRIYDLKGSTRHRFVHETGKPHEVLLDENLVQDTQAVPLFVREHSKRILRTSLHNDSLFLTDMNVMDYSLIVALDSSRHEMLIGIIDYLRTYTWDKRVESFVKETAILGGGGKGEPTIITPRQYRMRFLTFLDRNILMTPDPWMQDGWVQ